MILVVVDCKELLGISFVIRIKGMKKPGSHDREPGFDLPVRL